MANSAPTPTRVIGPRFGANAITNRPAISAAINSYAAAWFGRDNDDPVSALSSTWAWISTPGIARETGVVLMSFMPVADVPISTSFFAIISGGTWPSSTSTAET